MMTEEFKASKPIYIQIADRIMYQFVRGELSVGEKLPSVREMAIQSGVNPNTIQRTYRELEQMGIVESRRGQGTFLTEDSEMKLIIRKQLQKEMIESFVRNMREVGVNSDEMIEELTVFLQEGGDRK
ncbi:GntR family transcriptional regulator [Oikeobacillus pervagus]|uniref:GntR family transcriptional regulator n=2 Tax=Oikeobacillus pervagus TaxID=1325931 RepID=A0AAJ1T0Q7_9BACI|nr:GntR family transcriptional regulator [Oikeobacillus pervagus]